MVDPTCNEIATKLLDRKYYFGLLVGVVISSAYWAVYTLPQLWGSKSRMRSQMSYLIGHNDGIVTPTDLVVKAKVTPEKAIKFLTNFAQKLQVEAEVEEETGTRFYRFNSAKEIKKKLEKN